MRWTTADIPSQDGRVAIVTGSNTGLGFETAAELAIAGATVVLACRDKTKAAVAADSIRSRTENGAVWRSTSATCRRCAMPPPRRSSAGRGSTC